MKKRIPLYILGVLAAAAFPMVFLWMNNVQLVDDTGRVLLTLAEVCGCALVLWGLSSLLLRDMGKGMLCTVLLVVLFENGAMLQNLMMQVVPAFRYWHTTTLLVVLAGILIWLVTRLKRETSSTAAMIVSGLFLFYIVLNVGMALPQMLASDGAEKQEEPVQKAVETSTDGVTGRNVYWLLYDEYANNDILKKYFNYDNSPFISSLEDRGFDVSSTSESESDRTMIVTANITNLGYVVQRTNETTTSTEFSAVSEAQNNSVLIPLIKEHGYQMIGIGEVAFYGYKDTPVCGGAGTELTLDGDDTVDLFWKQTIISPFVSINMTGRAADMIEQLTYLQNSANIPSGNTFVLAHFECPHTPYLFAADGSLLPGSCYNKSSCYLGQLQYLNGHIMKTVDNIIEHDPTAIIAIVSDHGLRSTPTYDESRRTFAALYDGGETVDIEGMTDMNIMIKMLNTALGTNIAYVEPQVHEEVTTH